MNLKKYFFIAFITFISNVMKAQIPEQRPSPFTMNNSLATMDVTEPSVARFQEYSFIPVDLYAGKAKIDIPFYEIKLKDVSIPISLSYDTRGILVNSVASRTGTGWVLNAGGNIGKSIKEIDDFKHVSRFYSSGMPLDCTGKDNAGQNALGHPLLVGWKYRTLNYCRSKILTSNKPPIDNVDISPDLYSLIAPGFTSQFYYPNSIVPLAPNLDIIEQTLPVEIEPTGAIYQCKIKDMSVAYDSSFPSFMTQVAQDKRWVRDYFDFKILYNGIQYTFGTYDVSYINSTNSYFHDTYFGGLEHPQLNFIVSSWHLTEMKDVNTGKKVTYEYESVPYYTTTQLANKHFIDDETGGYCCGNYIEPPVLFNNATEVNLHINPKRLKSIKTDDTTINFTYGLQRQDLLGDYALTQVQIVSNIDNIIIKTYLLNYKYMNQTSGDSNSKRLMLDYIEESGKDDFNIKKKTILEYYPGNIAASNSINQSDWYGYYLNNPSNGDRPILYMHPEMKELAILPVPLSNKESYFVGGDHSIYPNDNDLKKGMLKKLIYPTKGYTELDYESNVFKIGGNQILGGGLRIKSQKLSADGSSIRNLTYNYTEPDDTSSGYVNNVPSYGYPLNIPPAEYTGSQKANFIKTTFLTYIKSLVGLDVTQNNYVGYSRVKEEEIGNGFSIYEYTSPKKYRSIQPVSSSNSYYIRNSALPFLNTPLNFDAKTGKLVKKEVYNSSAQLIQTEENSYTYDSLLIYNISRTRLVPLMRTNITTASTYDANVQLRTHRNLITNKRITNYFYDNGNRTNSQDEIAYRYNSLLSITEEVIKKKSSGKVESKKYYYPKDNVMSNEPFVADMIAKNLIRSPLKTEFYENSIKLFEEKVIFGNNISTNNFLLPKNIYSAKFPNALPFLTNIGNLEKKLTYDQYDDKGNILQYTPENGIPVSIIWGYNKTMPIAKIENIKYAEIPLNLITDVQNASDTGTEISLLNALSALRHEFALRNTMITTYSYKPLVGISTITDPKTMTTRYEYDNFGRLQFVRDHNGNILSENEYHYKN
jgi:YD repeat-containing protein